MTSGGEYKCVLCGCTDSRACVGGCSWVVVEDDTRTGVCTAHAKANPDTLKAIKLVLEAGGSIVLEPADWSERGEAPPPWF